MKQLKDQKFTAYTIKITKIREVYADGKYSKSYKDKMFCADIRHLGSSVGFCQPTLKKLFKHIKDELYL